MKLKAFTLLTLAAILVVLGIYKFNFNKRNEVNVLLLPSLPMPIAKEYALITSAGQSTDSYILNDISNKLMIHSYFMPQANTTDLDGINSIVFVVGYSSQGEKLSGISYENEKSRITELLKKASEKKLAVISIYIGGKERRDIKSEELLNLIVPISNYLIGTKDADYDGFLSKLAKKSSIPLTLINGVNNLSEPFASAYR
ncbi:DUF6305 family protein [Candidatus Clostridium radicumherbarum]|uniref:DUF6305 family protein n=1 Tax=Candidatus Clostridium radicumherbarum TaxID=3381662 RepID=A0ABW8TRT5_9CLOT